MGLVSKSIPNLINGVSQQPASLRLESQGELQENGFSDVVDGLKKRPPTKFLKKLVKIDPYHVDDNNDGYQNPYDINTEGHTTPLTENDLAHAFFHTYKRSDDVQYQVVITPDKKVRVYDIDGNLRYESGYGSWYANGYRITENSDDTTYLPDHYSAITATSVADATFFVNKNKTVELSDVRTPSTDINQALVYLKSVNYGRDYTVRLTSKTEVDAGGEPVIATADAQTDKSITAAADGTSENNEDALKVSSVISDLRTSITSGGTGLNALEAYENYAAYESTPSNHSDFLPSTSSRTLVIPDRSSDVTRNTLSLADTDLIGVSVGGVSVPFDDQTNETGLNGQGWQITDDGDIYLPLYVYNSITLDGYRTTTRQWQRDEVHVYEYSGIGNKGYIEPQEYNNEPYFIVSSPDSGLMKDFNIIATDDDGGVNLKAFNNNAKSFTDLPNQCQHGFRIGVVGDNQKKEDDFHVVFEGAAGSGYWKETVANNLLNYYDLTTMPHTLRQLEDGSFTFSQASDNDGNTWQERKAGDNNTNPAPSFVGQKIQDIFFHRNRLGVLAGENVVFSEAGGYLNFWRTTVRTLLDSDPIDVSVSQNEVAELKAAVPIQDNLLLFSELNQFTLSATQLLTPAEVTIDQSTKYECDLTATPVGAGTSVFFATQSGEFSGVREFFTKTDTEIKDAPEVTSHIPKYIKGNITSLQASSNEDMLILLTDNGVPEDELKKQCYVYKWYNSAEERLQSSWSKWVFSKNIASVSFNNAKIFFTFEDGSYEVMDLAEVNDNILLDHKITNKFPAIIPIDYLTDTMICVTEEGLNLGHYDTDDISLETNPVLKYLVTGKTITFGEPYTFKYQLSEQVFKPNQQGATDLARLQLRKINFNFSNTGQFKVDVESVGRNKSTSEFTGRILGQSNNLLDQSSIVPDGNFEVGVQSQAKTTKITIINDSYLPSVFQSAEWEGFVTLRNQRL